ncbi:MAG: hypothetical protein ACE5IO_09950, partial [Thermoplasmata archaeon]
MKVSKKGINGLFFAAILSLLVFVIISIVSTDMKGETPDTRSPANYQGYSSCSGCHDNIITDWLGTNHSQAWVVLNDSGEQEDW